MDADVERMRICGERILDAMWQEVEALSREGYTDDEITRAWTRVMIASVMAENALSRGNLPSEEMRQLFQQRMSELGFSS